MPDSLWQTCQFYAAIVRKRYKEAADAGHRIEMGFASFPVKILFKEFGASFQIFYINRNVCQLHPSAPPIYRIPYTHSSWQKSDPIPSKPPALLLV